ncbi:hypothetical protein UlMin_034710 [Ulmus minor]
MNTAKAEAERLLGICEKLLQNRDLHGARDFAVLAQETEPLLDGSDQILAVVDVLISAEKRINNQHDWYSILQLDSRSDDLDLIKKQYRRLALLLHPDKNKYAFSDQAFKLVGQAWAVLSDITKKPLYDNELSLFSKVDLTSQSKLPVRRTPAESRKTRNGANHGNSPAQVDEQRWRMQSFWTACPYCYVLYEYPRVYEDCCLKCQKCQRAFHAAMIPSLPPIVPGQEAYYCCWGFFPLGFRFGSSENGGKVSAPATAGFPNWMPPMFPNAQERDMNGQTAAAATTTTTKVGASGSQVRDGVVDISAGSGAQPASQPRKRGRPRSRLF